jgi:hypothetical protein
MYLYHDFKGMHQRDQDFVKGFDVALSENRKITERKEKTEVRRQQHISASNDPEQRLGRSMVPNCQ